MEHLGLTGDDVPGNILIPSGTWLGITCPPATVFVSTYSQMKSWCEIADGSYFGEVVSDDFSVMNWPAPFVNSYPSPRFATDASIAPVVTCITPFFLPLTHNPPSNKCSMPDALGYSHEGCWGQSVNPCPIVPKFVMVKPMFPTLV